MIAFGYCDHCYGVTVFGLTSNEAAETGGLVSGFNDLMLPGGDGTAQERHLRAYTEKLARTCVRCGTNTANVRYAPIWSVKDAFALRDALNAEYVQAQKRLELGAQQVYADMNHPVYHERRGLFATVAENICYRIDELRRLRELLGALETLAVQSACRKPYYVHAGMVDMTLIKE